MTATVYFMVGLPGSGKSTFIKNVLDGFAVLSTDDYIEQMASIQNKTYDEAFKDNIKDAEDNLKKMLDFALNYNLDIVWDQTNLSKKTRANKLIKIPVHYRKIAIVVTPRDTTILKERLDSRAGKTIPEHIFNSMLNSYVKPTLDEGFDFIYEVIA